MTAIIESLLRIFQWAIIIFTGSFIGTILFILFVKYILKKDII